MLYLVNATPDSCYIHNQVLNFTRRHSCSNDSFYRRDNTFNNLSLDLYLFFALTRVLPCPCMDACLYSTPRRGVDHWVTLRGAELSERVRSRGACFADRKTLYWIPSEMSFCLSEVISSRAYFAAQNKNGQNESTITRSVEWFLISLTSLRSLSGFSSKLRKVDLQSQLQSLQSIQRHQSMRLFIYILSVLVFIEADDNVSEPRETVNPTTPIHIKSGSAFRRHWVSQKSTRHNTAENAVAPRECGCYLCTHFGPTTKK